MIVGKIKDRIRLWTEIDFFQSLKYRLKLRLPRCSKFHIYPRSIVRIEKGGVLDIKKGHFMVNASWIKGRKRQYTSQLIVNEEAKLIVEGSFGMYQGASIYLAPNAEMLIKGQSFINTNTIINCFLRIEIGKGTVIGDDVRIQDSDNHTIIESGESKMISAPIIIGDHCWIAKNVIILKGVTIGDGAIIGAGAVVVKDIPARCLAVGNPAHVIKKDVEWK